MLRREAKILAKRIYYEPSCRLRIGSSSGRSMTAATKPSAPTTQTWRKTRKKVGLSMSKDAIQDAEKKLVEAIRNEKISSSSASKLNGNAELPDSNWVPPAYRGVVDEDNSGNFARRQRLLTIQSKGIVRPRRVGKPRTDRYVLHTKDLVVDVPALGLPEQALIAKQRKVESVMNDISALTKAAASYRTRLCGGDPTASDENQSEASATLSNKSFQQQIASVVQSIHDDVTPTSEQFDDSVSDFQSLCQILQQICSSAIHLSTLRKFNDQDANVYIDLAEYTLLGLVQINNERLMLRDKKNNKPEESTIDKIKTKSQSAVTGWFNQIVEGLTPSILSKTSNQKKGPPPPDENVEKTTIDTSTMKSMMRLLRSVLAIIVSTTKEPEIPLVAYQSPSYGIGASTGRMLDEKLIQRMTTLLEKTSSVGVRDNDATISVMEVLARSGTLQNARLCHDIHQKYSIAERHVSFSFVLEAYLEAIKQETNQETVRDIVDEVMNIQKAVRSISHRTERIIHASTVLNCLAVADMGKVNGMCASAELMVKRALHEKPFIHFVEQVESENPGVDSQLVPIANYLAQLYATSGQSMLESTSAKLLKYAMADTDSFSAMTIYPTRDTCNAVLQTLVQSASQKDDTAIQNDYNFARRILKCMFSKIDMGCIPNQTTYDYLFTLLEATNTSEIGTSGEELLSYIEASNLLSISNTFSLPYTTYVRVLHCYLKMAKSSSPTTKINEKNLPYRRAAHLLRKLEIRSTPMVLHNVVLREIAVANLYSPQLRPYSSAYELVMQICANTSQPQYQAEAADVALEIYRTRFQYYSNVAYCWDTVLENCTNAKLVELVKKINDKKI
jgi:hypothetical protein